MIALAVSTIAAVALAALWWPLAQRWAEGATDDYDQEEADQ